MIKLFKSLLLKGIKLNSKKNIFVSLISLLVMYFIGELLISNDVLPLFLGVIFYFLTFLLLINILINLSIVIIKFLIDRRLK
jgi:hypothetical protein